MPRSVYQKISTMWTGRNVAESTSVDPVFYSRLPAALIVDPAKSNRLPHMTDSFQS